MQNVLNEFQTECPVSLANAERNKKITLYGPWRLLCGGPRVPIRKTMYRLTKCLLTTQEQNELNCERLHWNAGVEN